MSGLGILIGTATAITIFILSLFCVPGPDKALSRLMAGTTVICCWLMWVIVYMSQMNPLISPLPAEPDS